MLYALVGFSGGVCCYLKDGVLCYELNLFEIERTKIRCSGKISADQSKIEIESKLVDKIGGAMEVTLRVNGKRRVPRAMSLHFTGNATFDIGTDLDLPVLLDYDDDTPFDFNGTIGKNQIVYVKE